MLFEGIAYAPQIWHARPCVRQAWARVMVQVKLKLHEEIGDAASGDDAMRDSLPRGRRVTLSRSDIGPIARPPGGPSDGQIGHRYPARSGTEKYSTRFEVAGRMRTAPVVEE